MRFRWSFFSWSMRGRGDQANIELISTFRAVIRHDLCFIANIVSGGEKQKKFPFLLSSKSSQQHDAESTRKRFFNDAVKLPLFKLFLLSQNALRWRASNHLTLRNSRPSVACRCFCFFSSITTAKGGFVIENIRLHVQLQSFAGVRRLCARF